MPLDYVAEENRLKLDLHNLTKEEAKYQLIDSISFCQSHIKQIVVVHGYSLGTVLLKMVRTEIKHPRIKSIIRGTNPGITLINLNNGYTPNLERRTRKKKRKKVKKLI